MSPFTPSELIEEGMRLASREPVGDALIECWVTDRVSVTIESIPQPRLCQVELDIDDNGEADSDDLRIATALMENPQAAGDLLDWRSAVALAEASEPNGFWALEAAMRALDLVEQLGVTPEQSADRGLWASWLGSGPAAVQALGEIGHPSQARGGNALRLAVGNCAALLSRHPDSAVGQDLHQITSTWHTPVQDRPIPGDQTVAELLDSQQPVFRTASPRSVDPGAPRLSGDPAPSPIDLSALVDRGLVDATAVLTSTQVAPLSWELRIPLSSDVATALRRLHVSWQELVESDNPAEDRTDLNSLAVSYGYLLALTPLPFSWTDLTVDLRTKEPAPPHLPDVVAVVSHGALRAPFTFMERLGREPRSDALKGVLVTTIPHRQPPTARTVEVRTANRASPIGRNRGGELSDLVLQARGLVAEGSQRSLRAAGRIYRRLAVSVSDLDSAELGGLVAGSKAQLAESLARLADRCFSAQPQAGSARMGLRAAAVLEEMSEVAELLGRELLDLCGPRRGASAPQVDEVIEVANALYRVRSFLGLSGGTV